jgi:ABC-type sugar transport system ATPase subunit
MSNNILLDIKNISKRFGIVQALREVSFQVSRGEVHTILGENGAGKSTLVKIIKGELRQDSGNLIFEGNDIKINDPLYANSIGISMVHQELTIFDNLTVAENIYPNNVFRTQIGLIDKKRMTEEARRNLALFGLNINPAEKVAHLPLAEKQIIEILRSIALKRKLIILDEPTSGLNDVEVRSLMKILKRLRDEGITILYISHRIPEVMELSDRITILKDGQYVGTVENKDLEESTIINLMVGGEVDLLYSKKSTSDMVNDKEHLVFKNVSKKNSVHDIDFKLFKNEILGIFGLEGSGVNKLSQILFGLDYFDEGAIFINDNEYRKISPEHMIKNGFMYMNKDRKEAGVFIDMPASDNMAAPSLKRLSKWNFINFKQVQKYTESFIDRFNIAIPNIKTKPKNLSGGNQQKLMFSVCLGTDPDGIIANEPTRGVDVGAKAEIHKFILDLLNKNTSVILFSSELPELITLCDRVMIMKNNTIAGMLEGEDITEEAIMLLAAGSQKNNK